MWLTTKAAGGGTHIDFSLKKLYRRRSYPASQQQQPPLIQQQGDDTISQLIFPSRVIDIIMKSKLIKI